MQLDCTIRDNVFVRSLARLVRIWNIFTYRLLTRNSKEIKVLSHTVPVQLLKKNVFTKIFVKGDTCQIGVSIFCMHSIAKKRQNGKISSILPKYCYGLLIFDDILKSFH